MPNVFSVPIFFITLRETIEAAIIVSVLLSLVENLVESSSKDLPGTLPSDETGIDSATKKKRLVRRMKLTIWAGCAAGLLIALCIGAAFIAVFFTTLSDLWSKAEEIWEGVFSLIACIIILIMGLTMLRIDRSKVKWQLKLAHAFDNTKVDDKAPEAITRGSRRSKWTLFLLPMITVLREGLEAVVFVGGVSLGESARSIPLAAIVGIMCGLIIGYLIYASGSRMNLSIFLVISTIVLFLLGAGLFSKSVGFFEAQYWNSKTGGDAAENGSGPGSFDLRGNIWHVDYGNPEDKYGSKGWGVFNSILGWSNNGSYGTVLSYIFYWLFVIACLVYMKWQEGRMSLCGHKSAAGLRLEKRRARRELAGKELETPSPTGSSHRDEKEEPAVDDSPPIENNSNKQRVDIV